MDIEIKVQGIEEINAYIDAMPKQAIKRAISKGLVAAAQPIYDAVNARKPSDGYVGGILKSGELAQGLGTDIEVKEDGTGGHMLIGYKTKKTADVSRWLEFGHKKVNRHGEGTYETTYRDKKGKLKKRTKKGTLLGDVKPYPYFRSAIEAVHDEAVDVFVDAVTEGFEGEQ